MNSSVLPKNISIRNDLRPGDLGSVIYHHGTMYHEEFGYGVQFENYVAEGLLEFIRSYDPVKDKLWVVEKENSMIAFLLLLHRPVNIAQLRYFFVLPPYRGMGIGQWLMNEFIKFLAEKKYEQAYLWTTSELTKAAKLYTHAGFVLVEETVSDFGKTVTEQKYEWKNKK